MSETSPIRILHLIAGLNIGGAEQNLSDLVIRMDRQTFQNRVVSMTGNGPIGDKITGHGIPVATLNMRKGWPDPRGILRLFRIIRTFRPDILQTWMYHANLLGLVFAPGRRLIWSLLCSDLDFKSYGWIYRLTVQAGAYCSKIPHAVIVNSLAGKITHSDLGYRPRTWEIILNGFDTGMIKPDPVARSAIRRELHIPPHAVAIGLIARLDPMKDHRNFFQAAHIVLASHPDVHFILAGRGVDLTNPAIKSLIQGTAFTDHFHLLGERKDIPSILAALDISVSSSISEGLPTAIGESMAAGLPCVVTDVGDSGRLVADTGSVVARRDPLALADAISRLIAAGPQFRADLGRKARERVLTCFSMDANIKHYENLYRSTVYHP